MKLAISNDLRLLVLGHDEHGRPFGQIVKIEFSGIIFGEWIKIAEIQFRDICR